MITVLAPDCLAQTIRGRLVDSESRSPIDLGLVMMFTESGDSVTATLTNPDGSFSLTSAEPGSFMLLASAYGYRETPAGVFELGVGGEMTVQFGIAPEPIRLDEVLVGIEQPVFDHQLIRQGFIRRLQRGLGHFITPWEIEQAPANETEDLFKGVPGVFVRPIPGPALDYTGDVVSMQGQDGPCHPGLFIDGVRVPNRQPIVRLSTMVPLESVEAIEVYRRPAEVPVEYGVTQGGTAGPGSFGGGWGACGVIVFWTKSGLARGSSSASGAATSSVDPEGDGSLPEVTTEGPLPVSGEIIRMELDAQLLQSTTLRSPWQGSFVALRERELIASASPASAPVAIPLDAVRELQVQRRLTGFDAAIRSARTGALVSAGMYLGLKLLCASRCSEREAIVPALATGTGVGLAVFVLHPGDRWVRASLPGRN